MSVKECSTCKQEISKKVRKCPNCNSPQVNNKAFYIVFIVGVLSLASFNAFYNPNTAKKDIKAESIGP
ncbi:hypothetical protein OAH87_06715 [Marinomonas sp.]|nr:hypothetical protein [Marinomonas sp.]MDB4838138.1 hypothetical protein [Marinomonas sp.]